MEEITFEEAMHRWNNDKEVYQLYDDGSEGLLESSPDTYPEGTVFGKEINS